MYTIYNINTIKLTYLKSNKTPSIVGVGWAAHESRVGVVVLGLLGLESSGAAKLRD